MMEVQEYEFGNDRRDPPPFWELATAMTVEGIQFHCHAHDSVAGELPANVQGCHQERVLAQGMQGRHLDVAWHLMARGSFEDMFRLFLPGVYLVLMRYQPEIFLTWLHDFTEYRDALVTHKYRTEQETHVLFSVNLLSFLAANYRTTIATINCLATHNETTFDLYVILAHARSSSHAALSRASSTSSSCSSPARPSRASPSTNRARGR
ncbi:AAA domain-containing protein [Mycena sanguinolenta]|uniref:AAA domain-containing protein n=1 Tax=Mycena sanguinolenta TaxID=230812 RepID=A0A8H7CU92_9AGAR|nr:AAA domain-containing protein [Mycena sanguinolenta]